MSHISLFKIFTIDGGKNGIVIKSRKTKSRKTESRKNKISKKQNPEDSKSRKTQNFKKVLNIENSKTRKLKI